MDKTASTRHWKNVLHRTFAWCGMLLASVAAAQLPQAAHQDPESVRNTVEQFLRKQVAGIQGELSIKVAPMNTRTNMPACTALQAFLPNGSQAWGKTTVGVRCKAPRNWTLYIPATVQVRGDYYIAATPLAQGQQIEAENIARSSGDLASLPAGSITDPAQAIGRTLTISITAGTPLRQNILREQQVVMQGQIVRIVLSGPGFSVSNEGRALNSGTEGQLVQARTSNGQVVSGMAKTGGIVVVSY